MKRFALTIVAFALSAPFAPSQPPEASDKPALPPATKRTIDFDKDIKPILQTSCISCHGPARQRGGLRLDSRAEAMKGGNSGVVIEPGKIDCRLLVLAAGLDGEQRMPPKGKPPLTLEQVGHLRAWIEQGAKWPKDSGTIVATVKSDHWAFQPIQRPAPPRVKNPAWVRNDIDAFVVARLEKEGIEPSPEADRLTLLRRVTLDLIGLPPTLEEIADYQKDTRPDAYERLVDKLLASPHYGERWGRHWLDLARYADSDGFEKDTWPALCVALSQLGHRRPQPRSALRSIHHRATGRRPAAQCDHRTEGGDRLPPQHLDEQGRRRRSGAVPRRASGGSRQHDGQGVSRHHAGLRQCHDHKYDPLSQREYYQMFAFFNSDVEVDIPAPVPGDEERVQAGMVPFEKKLKELQRTVEEYRATKLPAAQAKWERGLTDEAKKKLPDAVRDALAIEPEKRNDKQKKTITDHFAKTDPALAEVDEGCHRSSEKRPDRDTGSDAGAGQAAQDDSADSRRFPASGCRSASRNTGECCRRLKGDHPTRLDLAKWLVAPDNPLTSRVLMNWMWQKYFGRGLVATLEDFGTQGDRPSHPELLDWLASEVQRRKWSLKEMHKLIVTSATYRQSAKTRPELAQRDPLNVLLARQTRQRLDAEILRDEALAASGLLARTIGGPSVRPPQPPASRN